MIEYSEFKTTVKCNKTLKHNDGTISFIKGKTYSGQICNMLENLKVINEQNEEHRLGCWSKHFKNVSKY